MRRKGWNKLYCLFEAVMVTWEGRLREQAWGHRLISYNSFGSFQAHLWSHQMLCYYFNFCVCSSSFLKSQWTIIRVDDLSQVDPFGVMLIIFCWSYPMTLPIRIPTSRRRANIRKVLTVPSSIKLREFLLRFFDHTCKPIIRMTLNKRHILINRE